MSDNEMEWVREDAIRILALPVSRWSSRGLYGDGDTREDTYSNGTEADIAGDNALSILDHGPALRRALEVGIVALRADAQFDAYIVALYSGDHARLIELERAFAASFPADPDPSPDAMTPEQVAAAMIADLEARYPA